MAQDDDSPIYQNDTGAAFNPIFLRKDQTPVDLTDCTITMKMQNTDSGAVITCAGTWTINSDPTTGKASYAYASADVATAGIWRRYITISNADSKPFHADSKPLEILAIPS